MKKYFIYDGTNTIYLLLNGKLEDTLKNTSYNRSLMKICWGEESLIDAREGIRLMSGNQIINPQN